MSSDASIDPDLAPVRRLDAARFAALVNDHAGARLTLLGPAPGGQVVPPTFAGPTVGRVFSPCFRAVMERGRGRLARC